MACRLLSDFSILAHCYPRHIVSTKYNFLRQPHLSGSHSPELSASHRHKPNRFKLKLNPHKIPTAFVIVDGYDDNELGDVTASTRLDEICISKQVVYVELGDHKIDDPEFIQYLEDIINEGHYKSVTLADVYMPNAIIKKLGLINVFTYDSAKNICKCIRSS